MFRAESQDVKGTAYVYIGIKAGIFNRTSYVYLRRMVINDLGAELAERLFKSGRIPYVALDEFGFGRDVVLGPRREIVDHENLVALGDISFAYPGAYESRSTCDYYPHFFSSGRGEIIVFPWGFVKERARYEP